MMRLFTSDTGRHISRRGDDSVCGEPRTDGSAITEVSIPDILTQIGLGEEICPHCLRTLYRHDRESFMAGLPTVLYINELAAQVRQFRRAAHDREGLLTFAVLAPTTVFDLVQVVQAAGPQLIVLDSCLQEYKTDAQPEYTTQRAADGLRGNGYTVMLASDSHEAITAVDGWIAQEKTQ